MSEEMIQQLIRMVAENNKLVKELLDDGKARKHELSEFKQEMSEFKQEMSEFKQEMIEFKQEMYEFRDETNRRFDRLDRHLLLLDSDFELLHRKTAEQERDINRLKNLGQ